METMNAKVKNRLFSFKKYKIKSITNHILILKILKFQVVHMCRFKIILHKPCLFIRDQIKHIQIKWPQVLKSNQWQGLSI